MVFNFNPWEHLLKHLKQMTVWAFLGLLTVSVAVRAQTTPANLPETVTGVASEALVLLATTGNPEPLQKELGGKVVPSSELEKKLGSATLATLINLDKKEQLAPMGLIAPTGEWYNMVAPTITKDNFILVDSTGVARRMSVGKVAGTNRPSVVVQIQEDGGTPWYVELWYWVRIHLTGS
jgi:hypothetical protein